MILHNLHMTTGACPTQWEATNEKGEPVYIRYRWDRLTVNCPCPFLLEEGSLDMGPFVFEMDRVTGQEGNGMMETEDMLRLTSYLQAPDTASTVSPDTTEPELHPLEQASYALLQRQIEG